MSNPNSMPLNPNTKRASLKVYIVVSKNNTVSYKYHTYMYIVYRNIYNFFFWNIVLWNIGYY